MTQEEFLRKMWPHALAASQATGIDPRIIMAQSAIETGWGKSAPNNNYFGMKDFSGNGAQLATTEEVNGKTINVMQPFARYGSPEESAAAYVNQMQTNPAFSKIGSAPGYGAQVAALGKSGYATSSAYPGLVDRVATGLTVPTDVQPSTLPVGNRFINGPGAGANGQMPTPAAAPDVFMAKERTENDADLGGNGGSPRLPDATGKPFDFLGFASRGLATAASGEGQAPQQLPWIQQAMNAQGQVHRPQMQGGLLTDILEDPEDKKRRLMAGLLGA